MNVQSEVQKHLCITFWTKTAKSYCPEEDLSFIGPGSREMTSSLNKPIVTKHMVCCVAIGIFCWYSIRQIMHACYHSDGLCCHGDRSKWCTLLPKWSVVLSWRQKHMMCSIAIVICCVAMVTVTDNALMYSVAIVISCIAMATEAHGAFCCHCDKLCCCGDSDT